MSQTIVQLQPTQNGHTVHVVIRILWNGIIGYTVFIETYENLPVSIQFPTTNILIWYLILGQVMMDDDSHIRERLMEMEPVMLVR